MSTQVIYIYIYIISRVREALGRLFAVGRLHAKLAGTAFGVWLKPANKREGAAARQGITCTGGFTICFENMLRIKKNRYAYG